MTDGESHHSKAATAEAWEPVVPLPPMIAATGATMALWMPRTRLEFRERLIIVEDGDSPGLFDYREVFEERTPSPDRIKMTAAEIRRNWTEEIYRLRSGKPRKSFSFQRLDAHQSTEIFGEGN